MADDRIDFMENKISDNCKFLLDYSKDQILQYIFSDLHISTRISERDFLFTVWKNERAKIEKAMAVYCNGSNKILELATERDIYAKKMNISSDIKEKLFFLKKIDEYHVAVDARKKKWDELQKRQKNNDELYEKMQCLPF